MPKKLTDDQIQRVVWALLVWLSETPGTPACGAAKDACRSLAKEIKSDDKYGVSELIQGCREVRLNATIKRLMKERDDLKKELEKSDEGRSYYQKKNAGLETRVEGLLAERKEALFALGAVDAE